MRLLPFRLLLLAVLAVVGLSYGSTAGIRQAQARPTAVLALDPAVVNAFTQAACAPACDLTDPLDLLAVAEVDGDGDGNVEEGDFAAVDLDGDQLGAESGVLWIVAFVTNDGYVHFDADEGVFSETGSSQVDCQSGFTDEDCDDDGVTGDGVVVTTLAGAGLADLGSAIVTVSQSGIDVEMDYTVVLDATGSVSGTLLDADDNPLQGCHVYAHPLDEGGSDSNAYTGVSGLYTVSYVATGDYAIEVHCFGYVSEYYDDALDPEDADPVAVTDGENTPDINFSLDEVSVLTPTPSPWDTAVIATIQLPLGSGPWGIAVNPVTNRVYVSNPGANTVSVIDGATNAVVDSVAVGQSPMGIAVNPDTNRIFVANRNDNSVSVLDGLTNTVITSIPTSQGPGGVAVNPATNLVYVDSFTKIWVIDGAMNTVTTSIPLSDIYPGTTVVNPVTNRIYVGRVSGSGVAIIDGASNEVIDSVPMGYWPRFMAVNPSTNRIYAHANSDFPYFYSRLYVIDGSTGSVAATITDIVTGGVAANPTTNHIYFATWTSSDVASVLDGRTDTVIGHVTVGASPKGVGANPVTNRIYVANHDDDTVTVISDPLPAVGGVAAPPDMSGSTHGSSNAPVSALAILGAGAIAALAAAGWWARRRRVVSRGRED